MAPRDIPSLGEQLQDASAQVREVEKIANEFVMGQEGVVRTSLTSVIAGGHVLLEAEPGMAKTRLVRVFGKAMGLGASRIQFVPDMMPADILGMEMLKEDPETGEQHLKFMPGPVYAHAVHGDEINRASPRTQSALLQAMEEGIITVAGVTYILPSPFIVFATQNPVDAASTFALPEAQMDRFMIRLLPEDIQDPEIRKRIMRMTTVGDQGAKIENITPVFKELTTPLLTLEEARKEGVQREKHQLKLIQELAEQIPVGEDAEDYIEELTRRIRPNLSYAKKKRNPEAPKYITENFTSGATGERGAQALVKLARATAMLEGRQVVVREDVEAMAAPALTHRLHHVGTKNAPPAEELVARLAKDVNSGVDLDLS